MLDEFIWIKRNEYSIALKYTIDDQIDYYTDVKIIVFYLNKEYEIFNDNLLYLKNIITNYLKNINDYIIEIDNQIDIENIGLLQNTYYYCISQSIPLSNVKELLLDNEGEWIGLKYSFFESKKYSTWIYKKGSKINIKISPLFQYFFDKFSISKYKKFVKNYNDIINFEIEESELVYLYDFINEIYEDD